MREMQSPEGEILQISGRSAPAPSCSDPARTTAWKAAPAAGARMGGARAVLSLLKISLFGTIIVPAKSTLYPGSSRGSSIGTARSHLRPGVDQSCERQVGELFEVRGFPYVTIEYGNGGADRGRGHHPGRADPLPRVDLSKYVAIWAVTGCLHWQSSRQLASEHTVIGWTESTSAQVLPALEREPSQERTCPCPQHTALSAAIPDTICRVLERVKADTASQTEDIAVLAAMLARIDSRPAAGAGIIKAVGRIPIARGIDIARTVVASFAMTGLMA